MHAALFVLKPVLKIKNNQLFPIYLEKKGVAKQILESLS
jgi:hypothetical protein